MTYIFVQLLPAFSFLLELIILYTDFFLAFSLLPLEEKYQILLFNVNIIRHRIYEIVHLGSTEGASLRACVR